MTKHRPLDPPRLIRDATGKEVAMFTTPSGVRGIVATSIPREALVNFVQKLQRKVRRQERSRAAATLADKSL